MMFPYVTDFHEYQWETDTHLYDEQKTALLEVVKKRLRFGRVGITVFFGLIIYLFVLMMQIDYKQGGTEALGGVFPLFCCLILPIVLLYLWIMHRGSRMVRRIEEGDFVWRVGRVTRISRPYEHHTGYVEVDGQRCPYYWGYHIGDTVIVVGFDTADDSKTTATFFVYPFKY